MTMKMTALKFIPIFWCFSLSVESAEKDLCLLDEVKVAGCETTKNRFASICSSKSGGRVSYRFGRLSKVELDVLFREGREIFRWVDLNTYITFFGFSNGGYSYVFGVPQETYGARAYLHVQKTGSVFTYGDTLMCLSNSFGEKMFQGGAIVDVSDESVRTDRGLIFPPR